MKEEDQEERRSDIFGWWLFGGIFLALGVVAFFLSLAEREGSLTIQVWVAPAIVGSIGLASIATGIYSAIKPRTNPGNLSYEEEEEG